MHAGSPAGVTPASQARHRVGRSPSAPGGRERVARDLLRLTAEGHDPPIVEQLCGREHIASALAPTRYGRQFARRIAVQNFVWIGAPFRWISPRKLTSTS
jgi:hypothetical protein